MTLKEDKNKIKSGLYIVSTPIGNLRDITLRALDILKKSNIILCEDTRVSKKLLSHYEIQTKLISNYKFNEKKNLEKVVNIINQGKIVSLISDAGTPAISDPGKLLINRCIEENILIVPIPGPSAVTASISVSNFSDQFYFHGFLSDKINSIRKEFEIFKKDLQDTRIKHVFLNEKGKKIFSEIFEIQKKRIYNALLNSSSEEVINFDNVLKKIING